MNFGARGARFTPILAFELLREKFVGESGAVDAFRNWCTTHDVQHEFDSWI